MNSISRKLTTILQMDVARYSAAMENDEENTFRKLLSYREVIDRLIDAYQGRIFNTAGDAVLAEFSSPIQAVRFSIECQDALAKLSESAVDERNFAFRIGINLGDVMISDGDLLGDEVNIAARIEGLAEPGGICISAKVHEEVKGRIANVEFVSIGTPPLKNIKRPIEVFSLSRKKQIERIPTSSVLSHWGDNDAVQAKGAVRGVTKPIKFSGNPASPPRANEKRLIGSEVGRQDHQAANPGSSAAGAFPRAQKKTGVSTPPPVRLIEKPKDIFSGTLKSKNQRVLPPFVVDCLRKIDTGDERAIVNLLRFSGENPAHQLAETINQKLAVLIEAATDADKLLRIGSICDQSKEKSINEKALISYRKAAVNGSTAALEHLGRSLISKPTVKFDIQEGVRCLESAASLRSSSAAMYLGELLASGLILEKDLVQAFLWYWAAAHLGDSAARSRLKGLSVLMTPEQRRLAAGKADDFYRDLMLKKYYKTL